MKLKWALFLLLLGATGELALIPDAAASSIYSRNGIGLLRYYASAMAAGMGGVGIAAASRTSLPFLNPAGLSFINLTRFEGSFLFEKANVEFAADNGRFTRTILNSFQMAFPLKSGYGLGLGLVPHSVVAYKLSSPVEINGTAATETLSGSGGLERGFVQLGGMLSKWLAVGIGFDVYFGRIERSWVLQFNDANFSLSNDLISSYFKGVGGRAGVLINLGHMGNAGAVFIFPSSLDVETTGEFVFGGRTEKAIATTRLPFAHGYGLTLTPNPRFAISTDAYLQNWSSIDPAEIRSARTTDTYRFGFGLSFLPSLDALAGFFSRIDYRLGFNTSRLPYLDINGKQINEKLVSLGLSIPYNRKQSSIDLSIEFGRRGSLAENTAEETVFRFVAGISGGERWFVRR